MTSYFNLELDTTPPILEIFTPNNTTNSYKTPIIINSNELLLNYQKIYTIDSKGTQQNLTLIYKENYFEGEIVFNNEEERITIFAKLKDIVGNTSALYAKTIRVHEGIPLLISLQENTRSIRITDSQRKMETQELKRKLDTRIK